MHKYPVPQWTQLVICHMLTIVQQDSSALVFSYNIQTKTVSTSTTKHSQKYIVLIYLQYADIHIWGTFTYYNVYGKFPLFLFECLYKTWWLGIVLIPKCWLRLINQLHLHAGHLIETNIFKFKWNNEYRKSAI